MPVAQLNIFSDTLSTERLFDYGLNFIRIQLFTIPGFSSPAPMGGVSRSIMVNLDPTLLYGNGMSAYDIGNALAAEPTWLSRRVPPRWATTKITSTSI